MISNEEILKDLKIIRYKELFIDAMKKAQLEALKEAANKYEFHTGVKVVRVEDIESIIKKL